MATVSLRIARSDGESDVPALAPTTVPDWVFAEENLIAEPGPEEVWVVRHTFVILFKLDATHQARRAAIELTGGRVEGGDRIGDLDGVYYVFLGAAVAFDSTTAF